GSVASVQAKDFNKGISNNPDQLLTGKVAGLQIINSSGQPGGATVVKIRGNNSIRSGNTPLYVIDGLPLDGRSPRPGLFNNSGLGTSPSINPLNFINPADIASIDVLKDASASAIYGSRGANGVILITTRKGQNGPAKIEVGASVGIGNPMRKIDILDADGYRSALKSFNAPVSDSGASIKPFDEILNKNAVTQNYSVAFSGGNENGKYRGSFLASDQDGIIRKSGLTKYVGNFNGQYKFLDKKLSFDFNVTAANIAEQIAPVSNDAGSAGNIISLGLIWNPTLPLKWSNGLYDQQNKSGQVNPIALSEAYNDHTSLTTILGSFSAGYKITPDLEYKLLYGVNYGTGLRKQELQGWIQSLGADAGGSANVSTAQLFSQTITHTLSYNKKLTSSLNLSAVAGYEYWKTSYQGNSQYVSKFNLNQSQLSVLPDYHYYDNMQAGDQGNLKTGSFKDPTVELQSYFGRAVLNYKDKYLFTGTIRSDGSSKFGKNNRYAYFPSVAAAWNISNEDFMKNGTFFNSLKLRVGYGQTGNQEFNPVDAALAVSTYNGYNNLGVNHFANPDLKWETVESIDAGIDFTILNKKVWGYVDYFSKKTKDPILDFAIAEPTAGSGTVYKNMDGIQAQKGWVTNKGIEVSLGAQLVEKKDFSWDISANATFVKNKFESPDLKGVPFIKNTGALNGQGSSGAYSQVIAAGQPIDVFYVPTFLGFDKTTGIGQYTPAGFAGDPNPNMFLGLSTNLNYKKWGLTINMHGSFGSLIFNNTNMSVLNISNIVGGRNIISTLVGNGESTANAITPSTRFLESGNYMKLGNAGINYQLGNIGKFIKGATIYVTGSNLFVISKYTGFDPEVNVDKTLNGIPSLGVDYIGYPTARTFILGVNFSLQ
ncbi:MAG TPA: SusC/RagA family TonB-linked outer membrane protein, partial [Panacibacter sp.]|nr:SusC/RagA family TonB-linked outer membrane protein [Panacibacter sp.]